MSSFQICSSSSERYSNEMLKVLQGNLHRSQIADDLLNHIKYEQRADVLILSEQYLDKVSPNWYKDALGTAAIWVLNTEKLPVDDHGSGEGFVWIRSKRTTIASVYFTPNEAIADFQAKLEGLEGVIQDMEGGILVAGDFNAKAIEWGMPRSDSRGKHVMEMAARRGLIVLNTGVSTFRRPGQRETTPDISLASEDLARHVINWKVMEDFTGSDHQYITFQLQAKNKVQSVRTHRPKRWNTAKMDEKVFESEITRGTAVVTQQDNEKEENSGLVVERTMALIRRACDASMPQKKNNKNRYPAYWWSEEIAHLRKVCFSLRRKAQRAKKRPAEMALKIADFLQMKKQLGKTIKRSKRASWMAMAKEVDNEPWGLGYRIVTRKLGANTAPLKSDEETMKNVVDSLFPTANAEKEDARVDTPMDIPLFELEELRQAVSSLQNKKAPGPDGIPSEALKAVGRYNPQLLLDMYNSCLRTGSFPKRWKEQRLVLISKGKGDPGLPSSYRPLCMLDTAGKLLEKLLKPRLLSAVQAAGDLSDKQYGFRKGRSTIEAAQSIVDVGMSARQGNHYSRPVVLLVTLDVKNAFNTARWSNIMDALRRTFKVPQYLLRMVRNYLKDRVLLYDTSDGPRRREVTAGAAQGSILGPDLWNISYDGILRMEMPKDTSLVGYADDIAATITARNMEEAQMKLNQVMRRVCRWMEEHGLALALQKTEIVILTTKRIETSIQLKVGSEIIETQKAVKHLGIHIDTKLTFWEHIRKAAEKASTTTTGLSRLMANIGGPRPSKRRLLMSVTTSILLYGAEIWADALRMDKYRRRMAGVQRIGAQRVACSYNTVSEPAVLAIAAIIPIDLLALEKKEVHRRKLEIGKIAAKEECRARTIAAWKNRWQEDTRGRWTFRLISDLTAWVGRGHGEVNYFLTQFLSGHGYFQAYLHKIGKASSPNCRYCGPYRDDASHTFFSCERWIEERTDLEADTGPINPENVISKMLSSEESWEKIATYVETVSREKKREEDYVINPHKNRSV